MTALVVALATVVVVLVVLVVALLRSHAEILRRLHELGAGVYPEGESAATPAIRTRPGVPEPRPDADARVHDVQGRTPAGSTVKVAVAGTGTTTLLAFLSSGCSVCAGFWQAFAEPEDTLLPGGATRLVVVTRGPEAESEAALRALVPPGVTTVMSSEAWADYRIPVAPYFLLVDGRTDRVIGEGAASSWTQVSSLLAQALADLGLGGDGRSTPASRRKGAEREAHTDDVLRRAGIGPGHPSLRPAPAAEVPDAGEGRAEGVA